MDSVYTKRIFKFLEWLDTNNSVPIEYIMRVSLDDGNILPIANDGVENYGWFTIFDLMATITSLNLEELEDLSKKTGIIPSELVKVYIALDMEGFIHKPHARELLDIIDTQEELSYDALNIKIRPWIENYTHVKEVERKIYSKYPEMISMLSTIDVGSSITDYKVVSQNVSYELGSSNKDLIEIFNEAYPTLYVPYMAINNGGNVFYKIFNDPGLGITRKYYDNIMDNSRVIKTPGTMVLMVWRKGDDYKNPTKDSIMQVLLSNGKMTLRFDSKGELESIMDNIRRSLHVSITNERIGSSNISFRVKGVKYNKYLFQILLTTNPIINGLLIMNEMNTPGSTKRSQMYQFVNMGSSLPIRGETPSMSIKSDDNDAIVTISDVNTNDIEYYKTLAARLLAIYVMDKKHIQSYLPMFPWISDPIESSTAMKTSINSTLDKLKHLAPDIFISKYSRKCQGSDQPTPITDDEVRLHEGQPFIFNKKVYNRQVMRYPQDKPKINLVCLDNPKKPFPALIVNELSNKKTYPYLPCCHGTDNFNQFTGMYEEKDPEKPSKYGLITNKILVKGKTGTIPYRVEELLQSIIPGDYKRLGTVKSPKSIIHSVLFAINEQYRSDIAVGNLVNINMQEKKFVEHFNHVIDKLGTGIARQEMHDYTDEQIRSYMNGEHYEYEFMFRFLEEFLGTGYNIFCFTNSIKKDTSTGKPGDMVIPRFKIFHHRVHRPELPTIILFKIWGAEGNNLDLPQYELIVREVDGQLQTVYDDTMTNGLQNYMNMVHDVIVLDKDMNIPNINYEWYFNNLNYNIVSQFIDIYGKMRALRLEKNGKRFDVVTCPSQPLKYPRFHEVTKQPYTSELMKELGEPYMIRDGFVYFSIGNIHGAYLIPTSSVLPNKAPIQITDGVDVTDLIEEDISTGTTNSTDRLVRLSKITIVLLQIMEWLFRCHGGNVQQFMEDVIWYSSDNVDTVIVYNIDKVPYQLPVNITISDAIQFLVKYMPLAIHQGKFIIYSDKMFYDIGYFLSRYERYARLAQKNAVGKLTNRFKTINDFQNIPNSLIFSTENDIKSWISLITNEESKISIDDRIIGWTSENMDPEIVDIGGKFYIIQNVYENNLGNCYSLWKEWKTTGRNKGYINKPLDIVSNDVDIEVFHLDVDNTISNVGKLRTGTGDKINVLEFVLGRYAAMLEID